MRRGYFYRYIYFGLLCLLISNGIFSQTHFDSLKSELQQLKGADRIHTLNLLAQDLADSDYEKAFAYAMEADSLSVKFGDISEQAFTKRNLGDIKFYNNNFEAAIVDYQAALKLDKKIENLEGIADDLYYMAIAFENLNKFEEALSYYMRAQMAYDSLGEDLYVSTVLYNIGYLYDNLGDNIKALEYYKQSVKITDSLVDKEESASTLNSIGLLYYSWGDYESALSHYQQSFSVMERAGNKTGMAQTLNNIGILYYDWDQKELALDYYMKSLYLENETGNEPGLSASYNNIGIIYADLKEYYKALEFYQKALHLDEKHGDHSGVATCLNNIGELYFELGDKQQAIEMLKQSLAIERKLENPENLAINYNTLGRFYHTMGEQKLALFYNDSSYRLAKSINSPEILMDNYLLNYQIYESLGSYKHALQYHEKYHNLRDSLFTQKTLERISEIQSLYEVDQHEKEIELLSSKNQLQVLELENKQMILRRQKVVMYVAMGGFTILLFYVLLFYFQIRQRKKAYLLLNKKNKEILEKRNEIIKAKEKAEESDRLKSTFLANISHELRTPLNGILGFAEILHNELKDPVYVEMSEAIHNSGIRLLETLNSIIDLSVIEINKLELYITKINLIDLIKERVLLYKVDSAKGNLEINHKCYSDKIILRSDPKILTNVLNNLIDNAIKYTKTGGITVESGIDEKGPKPIVWISVSDTGIGIPENRLDQIFDRFTQVSEGQNRDYEGAGLGLTICKKYIEVLQGEISVKSELGKGSEFLIRIQDYVEVPEIPEPVEIQNLLANTNLDDKERRPKILIVDNDNSSLKFMTEILEILYEISTTNDTATAHKLAAKNNYDAILMDANLDLGTNGNSALSDIHNLSNHKNTPIAALMSDPHQTEKKKNGYIHYIHKPFSSNELHEAVNEMLLRINK